MDFEAAENARKRRLRRTILRVLDRVQAKKDRGLGAMMVRDVVAGGPERLGDDDEFLALCRDLEAAGFLTIEDRRKRKSQAMMLGWLHLCITARGTALVEEAGDKSELVEDERI